MEQADCSRGVRVSTPASQRPVRDDNQQVRDSHAGRRQPMPKRVADRLSSVHHESGRHAVACDTGEKARSVDALRTDKICIPIGGAG